MQTNIYADLRKLAVNLKPGNEKLFFILNLMLVPFQEKDEACGKIIFVSLCFSKQCVNTQP